MGTLNKIEPATSRILQTEGFRLAELLRAMFGKEINVELNVTNVPQTHIDFLRGDNDAASAHFIDSNFKINLESENQPLPF